jgi:hypothetical protein
MLNRLKRLKNTINKYMADIWPDRLMTCQSERKSVISQRPSVLGFTELEATIKAKTQHTDFSAV